MCGVCMCVCLSVCVCVCVCVGVCGVLREKLSCRLHVLSFALHCVMHASYVRDRPWCKRSSKYVVHLCSADIRLCLSALVEKPPWANHTP